ncbi:acyl CoA binding protein-domain-containing protein [Phaeosphaeriaceae sp. PMI808]|nr:acyl CoA binding protein-domain-containing protein [Phaeosphaeriaceae sp. PMI808]
MSDSVDRVFSHALNTVNKIRTGSQKPPSSTRLSLYGLYKQAMEGDVDGIMQRPQGNSEQDQRAREKWDAWKQQNGLSRTEAKRRYITTLIDTMHKFASPSPDSRELVAELEFVWDQVKSNVPSSSSSSPMQTLSQMGLHMQNNHAYLGASRRSQSRSWARGHDRDDHNDNEEGDDDDDHALQIKSPMSQSEEDLEEDEAEIDRQEFVDAQDSQYNPNLEPTPTNNPDLLTSSHPPPPTTRQIPETPTPAPRLRSILPESIPIPQFPSTAAPRATPAPQHESAADKKWRARIEQALQKMTAEVAALREQLEARRLFSHSPHYRLFRDILEPFSLVWFDGFLEVLLGQVVAKVGVEKVKCTPAIDGWTRIE